MAHPSLRDRSSFPYRRRSDLKPGGAGFGPATPSSHGLTAWGGQGARGEAFASCPYDASYAGCNFVRLHAACGLDGRARANDHAPYSGWCATGLSLRASCAEDGWPYAGRHLSVIMVNGRRKPAIVPLLSARLCFPGVGLCGARDGLLQDDRRVRRRGPPAHPRPGAAQRLFRPDGIGSTRTVPGPAVLPILCPADRLARGTARSKVLRR